MKSLRSLSFTTQVVLSVLLGIAVGLFFGERIADVGVLGVAYVRLLQMTILPYIMVSLVQGFGGLSKELASRVAPRLALVMLMFWLVGLTWVLLTPFAFPNRESASFFNPSILEVVEQPRLVDLFIPANPFQALSSGTIPAVVLFSILFGVALMELEGKQRILGPLQLVTTALTRVTMMVVKLTPIGVFAMTAEAAGTMELAEFARLQVYFTSYIGGCLLLSFVVFPLLVSVFTPYKPFRLLHQYKAVLIMAFTTGNLFVALPLLISQSHELLKEEGREKEAELIDVLVPVAFNFPNMGKLIALVFVLFGAWFVGSPISPSQYPNFIVTGWVTFFGGIDLALPFMLSMMNLPADLFQIYSVSGVINGRFATLLACVELISITLITSRWLGMKSKKGFPLFRFLGSIGISLASALLLLVLMRLSLEQMVPTADDQAKRLMSMQVPTEIDLSRDAVSSPPPKNPVGYEFSLLADEDETPVRKYHVGYLPDDLPFSFTNESGELTGHDIELICRMAKELNLDIVLHPVQSDEIEELLKEKRLDLMLSGRGFTNELIRNLGTTVPYQSLTLGMVLTEERYRELERKDPRKLLEQEFRMAIEQGNPQEQRFRAMLPNSEIVLVNSPRQFYEAEAGHYDALLTTMEVGSAWNMRYPGYRARVLRSDPMTKELVLMSSPDHKKFLEVIDDWLRLQKSQGVLDRLYEIWFMGQPRPTEEEKPRWSVLGDVIGFGQEDPQRY